MGHKSIALLFFALLAAPAAGQPAADDALERSVDKALKYLADVQEADGSWRLGNAKSVAASALANMAFLSAGHVPGRGKYGQVVQKGVQWVTEQSLTPANGAVIGGGYQDSTLYRYGIATLLLAEVYGMVEVRSRPKLKEALEQGVKIVLKAQRTAGANRGGWRYQISGNDADVSVTGWQLLALKAAKNAGCDVPEERIAMALQFVKSCQEKSSGGFRYNPGAMVTTPCTATGILCLELCEGHATEAAKRGGAYLLKFSPSWNDLHFSYHMYYCSQAAFQLGGNYWQYFRPRIHKIFLDEQLPNGSWKHGKDALFGPVYTTAMAVLALTVEYRYLPIYQRGDD